MNNLTLPAFSVEEAHELGRLAFLRGLERVPGYDNLFMNETFSLEKGDPLLISSCKSWTQGWNFEKELDSNLETFQVNYGFSNMRTLLPLFVEVRAINEEDITEDQVWTAIIKNNPAVNMMSSRNELRVYLDHIVNNY